MSSPLIFVRDGRSLPYFPVTQAALDAIRRAIADSPPAAGHSKRLAVARSLYLALLELANSQRGHEVAASRRTLGDMAGMSKDLVSDLRSLLERAGVVRVEERQHEGQQLEHVWTVTEPPVAGSQEGPAERGGGGPEPLPPRPEATTPVAGSHASSQEGEEVTASLRSAATQSPSTSSLSGVTVTKRPDGAAEFRVPTSTPSQSPAVESNGNTQEGPAAKYANPSTPGAAAAPWMILELARLMRANDDRAKVPPLIAGMHTIPEAFKTQDSARSALLLILHAPQLKPWLDAARLLIDTDGREPREVVKVLRWCQQDEFWKTNILSWPKFREKYPQLRGRALLASEGRATGYGKPPRQPPSDQRSQLDALAGRDNVCHGCGGPKGGPHEPGCPDYEGKAEAGDAH